MNTFLDYAARGLPWPVAEAQEGLRIMSCTVGSALGFLVWLPGHGLGTLFLLKPLFLPGRSGPLLHREIQGRQSTDFQPFFLCPPDWQEGGWCKQLMQKQYLQKQPPIAEPGGSCWWRVGWREVAPLHTDRGVCEWGVWVWGTAFTPQAKPRALLLSSRDLFLSGGVAPRCCCQLG